MPLPKLELPPAQASYSAQPGATFKQVQLGGGRSRFRLDMRNAPAEVTVQWVCSPFQWQYLQAFIRTAIDTGALDFAMDLVLDDALPAEYRVHLIPNSFGLAGTQGLSYTARAQMEVIPLPVDAVLDESMMMLFGIYQEDAPDVVNMLSWLANERLTVLS